MQVPEQATLLGNWEQVEDLNFNWPHLINKLKSKAISIGSNLVKINEYYEGSKTKGHDAIIQ
jgi:hypothetical protein